jgi:plasmid stability protein
MKVTVSLPAALEQALRQRSAASGRTVSALMRDALQVYLDVNSPPDRSAFELGADFGGRHHGPADLASQRKAMIADQR